MSPNRIIIQKRSAILIVLVTLAFGLIGTSFSTLHEGYEYEFLGTNFPLGLWKVSYGHGFPLWWYGYSFTFTEEMQHYLGPVAAPPMVHWFSLGSLLLDAAFWFAISFFACAATMKSVKILLRTIASKVVVTYFLASASFSVVGLSLYLFSYGGLGLRLYGFGLFLVAATLYQSLAGRRKKNVVKETRLT